LEVLLVGPRPAIGGADDIPRGGIQGRLATAAQHSRKRAKDQKILDALHCPVLHGGQQALRA
jgi:hypothetical protein